MTLEHKQELTIGLTQLRIESASQMKHPIKGFATLCKIWPAFEIRISTSRTRDTRINRGSCKEFSL